MRIAVYGTLRRKGSNYERFSKYLNYLGPGKAVGYSLYDLGPYPCAVRSKDNKDSIRVDVFEFASTHGERLIDGMEINAGYHIDLISVTMDDKSVCECKCYLFKSPPRGCYKIESGDWVLGDSEVKASRYARLEEEIEKMGGRRHANLNPAGKLINPLNDVMDIPDYQIEFDEDNEEEPRE